MADFQDRVLKCVDCGADFVFTAGEQHFFHDKNFKNEPKRCKNCKTKRAGFVVRRRLCQNGNHDHLLAMRAGNHGSLQANPRPAGILPRMLPQPEGVFGSRRGQSIGLSPPSLPWWHGTGRLGRPCHLCASYTRCGSKYHPNSSQPAIIDSPPMGVMAPRMRFPLMAKA